MKKHSRRIVAVISLTLVLAGLWWWAVPRLMHMAAQAIVSSRSLKFQTAAPDFTLPNASGEKVRLADYKGQVVLLNFWATWCGPCQAEIPWFVEFEKKYRPNGFTVLGVSMDDDGWKVVKPFLAAKSVNYPVVLGDEKVNQLYGGIEALPTTLLLGRDGRIVFIHSGLIGKDVYRKEIQQLLAEKSSGTQAGS